METWTDHFGTWFSPVSSAQKCCPMTQRTQQRSMVLWDDTLWAIAQQSCNVNSSSKIQYMCFQNCSKWEPIMTAVPHKVKLSFTRNSEVWCPRAYNYSMRAYEWFKYQNVIVNWQCHWGFVNLPQCFLSVITRLAAESVQWFSAQVTDRIYL